jgi:small subunit ribosomal protein S6
LKPYEMLVLTKPQLGDEGLATVRGRLEGWLADAGARLEDVVDVGEVAIAYVIKKQSRGHYFLFWFEGNNEAPEALTRRIRVDEDILRHMIVERHPLSLKFVKPAGEEKERERSDGKRGKPDYSDRESDRRS